MGAGLSKELRKRYGIRSIEVRKGDEVKIMRGKFAKKQGKVGKVDVSRTRIQIDGVQRAKLGGEKVETWFHPSNVKIVVLNEDDNRRMKREKKVALRDDREQITENRKAVATEEKVVKKVKKETKKDAHKEN